MSTTRPLDPLASLDDFACLSARLAEPFANAGEVLFQAGTTAPAFQTARAAWGAALASQPELRALFAKSYQAERRCIASGRDVHSVEAADASQVCADETVMVARPVFSAAPLPFQAGSYAPSPLPVQPRFARPEASPDETQLPLPDPHTTLPFPKPKKP